ncbi:hypothetical protein ACDC01_004623 [Salmonella enterica]
MHGQDFLSNYLGSYTNDYVLIGGNACVLNFEKIKVEFRATADLDIVLIVDNENDKFYAHLCNYLVENGYTGGLYRCKENDSCAYRFTLKGPQKVERPKIIELFSKKPDYFDADKSEKLHITPIETEEGISNLSAILLDDEVYNFVIKHKCKIDNVSTVNLHCLFGLKSIAWHNNEVLYSEGKVKEVNVYKHPADMVRIATVLEENTYSYPKTIFESIQESKSKLGLSEVAAKIPEVAESIDQTIDFIDEFVKQDD